MKTKTTLYYFVIIVVLLIIHGVVKGQLFDQSAIDGYRPYFPKTEDEALLRIRNNPNLFFYTSNTVKKCYQNDGQLLDVSTGFNPNQVRPWRVTAGIDDSTNIKVLKFGVFPNENKQIVYETKRLKFDSNESYVWTYPEGMKFGEILTINNPNDNVDYTFEIRVLSFNGKHWHPTIYRPIEDLVSLNKTLNRYGYTALNVNKTNFSRKKIIDDFNIFNIEANFYELGKFDDKLVKKILSEVPFKSCRACEWVDDCHAATTKENFHIIPQNYQAAFLDIDSKSCAKCHSTVMKHAKDFTKFDSNWTGRVRGSHGIFSFHIFENNSINNRTIRLNSELLKKKLLIHKDEIINFKI